MDQVFTYEISKLCQLWQGPKGQQRSACTSKHITQITVGVVPFVSEMLRGTHRTVGVVPFVSEMLRGTQMTVGVVCFVSEMLRGTQMTVGVVSFMSEMLRAPR